MRKVGCFPPPVAIDPKVLNTRDFFVSVMLAIGPRILNSAPHAVLN